MLNYAELCMLNYVWNLLLTIKYEYYRKKYWIEACDRLNAGIKEKAK
jgi:hypothetical protein